MKILVVFCHPSSSSFGASIFKLTCQTLKKLGHKVRTHDLYKENFDPVLSDEQWQNYSNKIEALINENATHVRNLKWCEGLIVIYPTWYYGPPAMLKGWLEKIWLPGVTFEISDEKFKLPVSKLRHIRLFMGVTTSGSPWWWLKLIKDPGRNLWSRGLKVLFSKKCKVFWKQLYDINNSTENDRQKFLSQIEKTLKRIS